MSVVGKEGRGFGEREKMAKVVEMRNAELVWKRNGRGFVKRQGN